MPIAQTAATTSRENSFNCAMRTPDIIDSLPKLAIYMQKCWDLTHGHSDPVDDVQQALDQLNVALNNASW
jgi:hypothetical protein